MGPTGNYFVGLAPFLMVYFNFGTFLFIYIYLYSSESDRLKSIYTIIHTRKVIETKKIQHLNMIKRTEKWKQSMNH